MLSLLQIQTLLLSLNKTWEPFNDGKPFEMRYRNADHPADNPVKEILKFYANQVISEIIKSTGIGGNLCSYAANVSVYNT